MVVDNICFLNMRSGTVSFENLSLKDKNNFIEPEAEFRF